MKIAVIDGQGGGIGRAIIEKLSKVIDNKVELIALGTNSAATAGMIKAGAKIGATGENAIKVTSQKIDIIVGPIAIMVADSMMGEITSVMANAIARSNAAKILIPVNRCNMIVAGVRDKKLNELIESAINEILNYVNNI
jgi:NAD(P)-dependent dehydrogenase (short-subunit alcohol dehydrogenase family)